MDVYDKLVKDAYIAYRRNSVPTFRLGTTFDHHFVAAAELCNKYKVDPAVYIKAQIAWFQNYNQPLYANCVAHKNAEIALKQYLEHAHVPVSNLLEVYKSYIEDYLTSGYWQIEPLLLYDGIDIPAWFRIVASREPIPSVIAKYKQEAKKELNEEILTVLKQGQFDVSRFD